MRATIEGIEVEGTPAEVAAFARDLRSGSKPIQVPSDPHQDTKFVSEDFAFRVLRRRPLSNETSKMLQMLVKATPKWTAAKGLEKALDYSRSQLGGLFGAFGKRVNATDGYIKGAAFFDWEWNYEENCWQYRLPPASLAACRRAGL